MAVTHNYYRILNVKTTAGMQEILQALNLIRQKDTEGKYASTLQKIEETLSDPEKRGKYDDELGIDGALRGDYYVSFQIKGEENNKSQGFLDVSDGTAEQAFRKAQRAQKLREQQMTQELEEWEKSIASRGRILSMGRSFVFLGILAGTLLVAFFAAKPFYDGDQAKKQADAAYGELDKASKSIMDYIRANNIFPDTVPSYSRDGDYYDISVRPNEKKIEGSVLELTFNEKAYADLRESKLTFELYQIPNGILDWRCRAQIPASFAPVRCIVQ